HRRSDLLSRQYVSLNDHGWQSAVPRAERPVPAWDRPNSVRMPPGRSPLPAHPGRAQAEGMTTKPYPARLTGEIDPRTSRWLWLVKWLLAVAHLIVLVFLWG